MYLKINEGEDGTVTIGSLVIDGWIDRDRLCQNCGGRTVFELDFDANFCPSCDSWLDDACADRKCEFCAYRPARPMNLGQRPIRPDR